MGALSIDELKELRGEVVGAIADNPDLIAADPSLDYSVVLELVRTTGRTDLFKVALEKVRQIEDKSLQTSAWVEVLDAIEVEISLGTAVEEEQAQQASEPQGTEQPQAQQAEAQHQEELHQ